MLRYPEIKNNPSAEYGQSTTEAILNRLALFFVRIFFGLCCIFVMDLVQWVCAKKERWKSGKGSGRRKAALG